MFRFRLQQVLDLREEHERTLAQQLAQAMTAEHTEKVKLDELEAARAANTQMHAEPGTSRSVGEMAHLAFILEHLDGHIATAKDRVSAAHQVVDDAQAAFTTAFQDRRVLDRLRERHEEQHRTTEEQIDRRSMDELAISRYVHPDTP